MPPGVFNRAQGSESPSLRLGELGGLRCCGAVFDRATFARTLGIVLDSASGPSLAPRLTECASRRARVPIKVGRVPLAADFASPGRPSVPQWRPGRGIQHLSVRDDCAEAIGRHLTECPERLVESFESFFLLDFGFFLIFLLPAWRSLPSRTRRLQ